MSDSEDSRVQSVKPEPHKEFLMKTLQDNKLVIDQDVKLYSDLISGLGANLHPAPFCDITILGAHGKNKSCWNRLVGETQQGRNPEPGWWCFCLTGSWQEVVFESRIPLLSLFLVSGLWSSSLRLILWSSEGLSPRCCWRLFRGCCGVQTFAGGVHASFPNHKLIFLIGTLARGPRSEQEQGSEPPHISSDPVLLGVWDGPGGASVSKVSRYDPHYLPVPPASPNILKYMHHASVTEKHHHSRLDWLFDGTTGSFSSPGSGWGTGAVMGSRGHRWWIFKKHLTCSGGRDRLMSVRSVETKSLS